jgi:reactive intermediate/imine deaminase
LEIRVLRLAAVAERQPIARRAIVSPPIYHLIPNAPKPVAPYSHVVEADGWLFVTGQLATDPDDDSLPLPEGIEAQTRKVMDNLKRALTGAGAGFQDVVCVRIFLTNFERDYAAFNRLYTEYFRPDRLPARTTVGVTHLARGGIVEVDLIARRS